VFHRFTVLKKEGTFHRSTWIIEIPGVAIPGIDGDISHVPGRNPSYLEVCARMP
jgi:hypothetical protein